MKDIKSLYLAARSSGSKADISAYTEAIQNLIDNDPNSYIAQLEYIISSDIGLNTVKQFIEKNGFPIACYDNMIECLEECIRKCEVYKKNDTIYTEMVSYFENWRKEHLNCFMMFENFREDMSDNYVKTYYGKNGKGIQNNKLIAGMINTFGEAAIPDALITADAINGNAVKTVLEYISNNDKLNNRLMCEWVLTVCNDISNISESTNAMNFFKENCLTTAINGIKNREHQLYRESVIMGRDDLVMEYTKDDILSIQNLISFKEYQMTWMDEITESNINDIQNEIYSLYEMAEDIVEDDSDTSDVVKPTNEEYFPVYGIVATYTDSKYRNDDSEKSDRELNYANINKTLKSWTMGDNYSHALISFDDTFTKMYTYDGKDGFFVDNIQENDLWMGTESIYICVMFVTEEERNAMQDTIKDFEMHKDETKYAFSNLLQMAIGKTTKIDKRFVCSSFVGYIMNITNPKNIHRDYSRIRPEDITILPRSFYVMNVKDREEFNQKQYEIKDKVKSIYDEYKDEIDDYNNHLPKLMLQDRCDELKTIDKIYEWIFTKIFNRNQEGN